MPSAHLSAAAPPATTLVKGHGSRPGGSSSGTRQPAPGVGATLYLVRHGETLFNVKGITSGWSDSPLTALGEAQARAAAEALAGIEFAAAVTSDSGRARATAGAILAGNASAPGLTATPLLREEYFGGLEGDSDESWYGAVVASLGHTLDPDWANYAAFARATTLEQRVDATAAMDASGTAENWSAYRRRVGEALELLERLACDIGGNILVVSHHGTISLLLELMDADAYHDEVIPNASVTTVSYSDRTFAIEELAVVGSVDRIAIG